MNIVLSISNLPLTMEKGQKEDEDEGKPIPFPLLPSRQLFSTWTKINSNFLFSFPLLPEKWKPTPTSGSPFSLSRWTKTKKKKMPKFSSKEKKKKKTFRSLPSLVTFSFYFPFRKSQKKTNPPSCFFPAFYRQPGWLAFRGELSVRDRASWTSKAELREGN